MFLVVAGFGACMVVFGLSRAMWLSMLALALGGAFDMVSVVLRSTILPLVTPDELRGRVNAVEMVFISGSNELGAFESGVAAALIGAVPAVVFGGVATHRRRGRLVEAIPVACAGRQSGRPATRQRRAWLSNRPAPTLPIDASTSSIGWSAGSGCFTRRSACDTWTRHPGFALAYACAPVASTCPSLAVAELAGCLGLDDVVDPGRAAAEVLFCGLDDLEPGNARERRVRGERKPLRVAEMARVL